MRAFERLSHEVRVAYAFEAVVRAATGQLDQMRDQIAFDAFRIDEVRHAELTGKTLARRIDIDANDLVGTDHLRALDDRSEEHTSELQSLMRNSYAVFCLKKKKHK